MNTREDLIRNSDFFSDKTDLAQQILKFEREGKGFLPNSPRTAVIPPHALQFGNKPVTLGRIDKYFYFGVEIEENKWKYTAFEDDGKCIQFFCNIPGIDEKTLSFWSYQVNRLLEIF